ncbi:hypothetical protein TNCV_3368671 [Trichonephila clavipes]|nr:hypothetical protein TNCV_3368671 [Trichonephila clavipes]
MVELVKGISKLPDRRLEADRPRHSIQFINDDDDESAEKNIRSQSELAPPLPSFGLLSHVGLRPSLPFILSRSARSLSLAIDLIFVSFLTNQNTLRFNRVGSQQNFEN